MSSAKFQRAAEFVPSDFCMEPDFYLLRLVCISVNMSWEVFCMAKNCDQRRTGRTQGSLGQSRASVPQQSCIPPTRLLIANLELEFHVNPIRINELKFPNRKYFAIFRVRPRHFVASSLATAFLIETPRLEFPATPTKQRPMADSNRDRSGVFGFAFRRHSRIGSACNSLCDSVPLWPSPCAASHATLTLRAPQSNLPASCFVRALAGEHS
jgi:hypothetical protein